MLRIFTLSKNLKIKLLALTLAIFILVILVLTAYIVLSHIKLKSEQKKAETLTSDIRLNIKGILKDNKIPDFIEKRLLVINNSKLEDKKRYDALSDIAFYYAGTYSTLHDPSIRLFSIRILGEYAKQEFPHLYNSSVFEIPCSDPQCGQDLSIELDISGVAISPGAACSVRSAKPSYVIEALGFPNNDRAFSSLRFSLGRFTTKLEIDQTLTIFKKRFKYSIK